MFRSPGRLGCVQLDLKDHNTRLREVFEKLKINNLREFLRKEVAYLGHIITEDGVKMDPKKKHAAVTLEPPRTQKEVKSLLGMTGYYRRFVKDYGKIVNSNQRLKKDTDAHMRRNALLSYGQ